MKDAKTPSVSAAAVAMMRGAAQYLPAPMNTLAPDDVSWRLAGFTLLPAFFTTFPRLAKLFLYLAPKMAVWTTIRTRLIDDALLSFIEMGGKQARCPARVVPTISPRPQTFLAFPWTDASPVTSLPSILSSWAQARRLMFVSVKLS